VVLRRFAFFSSVASTEQRMDWFDFRRSCALSVSSASAGLLSLEGGPRLFAMKESTARLPVNRVGNTHVGP
jgi:hypothetical protein